MFRIFLKFIKRSMQFVRPPREDGGGIAMTTTATTRMELNPVAPASTAIVVPVPAMVDPVPAIVDPVPAIAVPADDYRYENDMEVICKWNSAAKDDVAPLIAMVRQLLLFSDCKKMTVRSYATTNDDIVHYVGKIKRRPTLLIDVSHIDIHNHPQIYMMYRNMRSIVGMHRVSNFMVRVEHAFDNSQIQSEHFVVSKLMNISNKSDVVPYVMPDVVVGSGIDSIHHIVLPIHVNLRNIQKIPPSVRTIFHHISYSIQPVVCQSHTLDTWLKREPHATNAQIMHLCIQMAEALVYLHDLNIVHSDIKPANTLVKRDDSSPSSLSLYLIDFGMSGNAGVSDGTGGTKPFCAPETGNGFNPSVNMDAYVWKKLQKHHDVWSMGLMFMTMIVFRKLYLFSKDYPLNFFNAEQSGHINPECFNAIQNEPMRDLFRRALLPAEDRITAADFLILARSIDVDCIGCSSSSGSSGSSSSSSSGSSSSSSRSGDES